MLVAVCFMQIFKEVLKRILQNVPQCNAIMDKDSWKALRDTMAGLADFNYHILKWNSERNEPRMLVSAITVSTLED